MATTKLTVKTDVGTFTRKTARTYTHIVVVGPERAELLESERLRAIASDLRFAAQYQDTHDHGTLYDARPAGTVGGNWDRECHAKFRAEGRYGVWAQEHLANAVRLTALGPITEDKGNWGVAGWNGRLDLAVKLAATQTRYREVRIYALDGTLVSGAVAVTNDHRRPVEL